MSLFKFILQGIGHTLGSEATRGALKKVGELAEEAEAEEARKVADAKKAKLSEKEEAAAQKKRAKEAAAKKRKDDAELDRELAALKKKVATKG